MATASLIALGVLAGVGAATAVVADRRATMAEARHPPTGEIVTIRGRRVHYTVSGEGPDVVLIHGAFGSLRDFTFDLVGRLDDRYRVIAFDRPGLGFSDHADARHAGPFAPLADTPSEQAAFLHDAAQMLGADAPIVVGHSFGGAVALAWALDHDPAAVVLFAGVAMPWPGTLDWMYRLNGTRLGGAVVAPLISAWTPLAMLEHGIGAAFAPQAAPEGYVPHVGPYMPVRLSALRATTRQVYHLRPQMVALSERYGDLTLPIEIVHGEVDQSVPLNVHSGPFSERVASANLTVLDGVGHMPHHADPDAALAAIDRAAVRAGLR